MDETLQAKIEQIATWMACGRNVVFTGAGISTESGLPDYRGPDGVWTRRDKGLPPVGIGRPWSSVEPNAGHLALVELWRLARLDYLVSQNVDNLHRKSGIPDTILAELHGNSCLLRCLGCDRRFDKAEVGWSRRFGEGYRTQVPVEGQPFCPSCKGRLISSVVNFGDPMPERELAEAFSRARACSVLLVIGTSLSVTPAANIVDEALAGKAHIVLINRGPTPYDDVIEVRIEESAGLVLTKVVERIRARLQLDGAALEP